MAKYRAGRVRQEILREVNNILLLEIKDPRVEGVTITDVNVTGDLQQATIYYSTLSDKAGERQKTQRGLDAITGKVRSDLGKKLTLYKTPEIKFECIVRLGQGLQNTGMCTMIIVIVKTYHFILSPYYIPEFSSTSANFCCNVFPSCPKAGINLF